MTGETAEDPWEGFTGQSEADAADAELIDPILKALGESRARFGDMEARLVAAEAVIEKVRAVVTDPAGFFYRDVVNVIDTIPSTVLADHDKEVAAQAWDELYASQFDGVPTWSPNTLHDPNNPYRSGSEGDNRTQEPTCIECGRPSTYRLGRPSPSWCDDHGPHRGDNR